MFPPAVVLSPGGYVGAAEVGGSLGLVGAVPPVTAMPPVLRSPGSGLAEHLLLQLRCWLHGTLLWVLVLGLVMCQLVEISPQSLELCPWGGLGKGHLLPPAPQRLPLAWAHFHLNW